MRRALAIAALLTLLAVPSAARADGDPASDVLLLQDAYTPYTPVVPKPVADGLNRTLKQLRSKGFPLKVAIIATATDLGSVPQFLGRPQPYAAFLESEIAFTKPKPLIVVMRDGYGTAALRPAVAKAVTGSDKPGSGSSDDLGRAAIDVALRAGAAAGHPVPAPKLPKAGGGGGTSPAIIVGVPLLLLAIGAGLAVVRARQRSHVAP